MGVKISNDSDAFFEKMTLRVYEAIRNELTYAGEEATNHARTIPPEVGYTDRTGNLRSSTGYALFENNQLVSESFEKVDGPEAHKTTVDGTEVGREHAYDISEGNRDKTFVMKMVAGMDYAEHLERLYHRDVLKSTEMVTKRDIQERFEKLKQMIEEADK